MSKFKFTGVNISAALLILAFFLPWFSVMGSVSMSGFSIASTGISPGLFAIAIKGSDRLLMILMLVVPLCGALILYQNVTGDIKFDKYYKPAHSIPAIIFILGLIILYFKIRPERHENTNNFLSEDMANRFSDLTPGLFDVLSFGMYLSLAVSIYLLLVNWGK